MENIVTQWLWQLSLNFTGANSVSALVFDSMNHCGFDDLSAMHVIQLYLGGSHKQIARDPSHMQSLASSPGSCWLYVARSGSNLKMVARHKPRRQTPCRAKTSPDNIPVRQKPRQYLHVRLYSTDVRMMTRENSSC